MYFFNLLIFVACVYKSTQQQQPNNYTYQTANHAYTYKRILELMRSYYEEANVRIAYMNPMRFMYEESPYYEMGYITGEIIERYRKVLEHAQKPARFKAYSLFDIMKHVELVQKLYFELYHLTRMIHETPRKWRKVDEFLDIEKIAGPDLIGGRGIDGKGKKFVPLTAKQISDMKIMEESLLDQKKLQAKEKKRQKKKMEKIRQAFLQGLLNDNKGEKKPYNTKWPIDYGWEVDFWW